MSKTGAPVPIWQVAESLGLELKGGGSGQGRTSFNVRCPFCHKFKLNINNEKDAWKCPPCGLGGGELALYMMCAWGRRLNDWNKEDMRRAADEIRAHAGIQQLSNRPTVPKVHINPIAPDERLDAVYSYLLDLDCFKLLDKHRDNLLERGLTEVAIRRNAYRSVPSDLRWVEQNPLFREYHDRHWDQIRRKTPELKYSSPREIVFGLLVGAALCEAGFDLKGIPGAYKFDGRWCFRLFSGIVIRTRNRIGQTVMLQVRRDRGQTRYMSISTDGLQDGTKARNRFHFPIVQGDIGAYGTACLIEGALKTDISAELYPGDPMAFVGQVGTNNMKTLPPLFDDLKSAGIKQVRNGLDMDKLTNPNVRKASRETAALVRASGLEYCVMCWDAPSARSRGRAFKQLCVVHNITPPASTGNPFVDLALIAECLEEHGVRHSVMIDSTGKKIKDYWPAETKGLDDYLNHRCVGV